MRKIIEILFVEKLINKDGEIYHRTHCLLDDGSEAVAYGNDFKSGDPVESFYDHKWNVHKIRKSPTPAD